MKQDQLHGVTDVIARNLETSYSSFITEPAPLRLQALLDQFDRAKGHWRRIRHGSITKSRTLDSELGWHRRRYTREALTSYASSQDDAVAVAGSGRSASSRPLSGPYGYHPACAFSRNLSRSNRRISSTRSMCS